MWRQPIRTLDADTPTGGCVGCSWSRMQWVSAAVCTFCTGVQFLCICQRKDPAGSNILLMLFIWGKQRDSRLRPNCCSYRNTHWVHISNELITHGNTGIQKPHTHTHICQLHDGSLEWSAVENMSVLWLTGGRWTFLHFTTTSSFITWLPKWMPDGVHCWLKGWSTQTGCSHNTDFFGVGGLFHPVAVKSAEYEVTEWFDISVKGLNGRSRVISLLVPC